MSIVAADQRARVQGGDRQQFNLNLMPETRERVNKSGVRLVSQVALPPGRYQIRIGAHETTGRDSRDAAMRPGNSGLRQDAFLTERCVPHIIVCGCVRDGKR